MIFKGEKKITNLYDSHVHWFYTGQTVSTWNLQSILEPEQILLQKMKPEFLRGDWITGFGWDETKWPKNFKIHREFLDRLSGNQPIHLSRTDGHSGWVNTEGLKRLGFFNKQSDQFKKFENDIVLDEKGFPSGLLKESAHLHALFNLPQVSHELTKSFLLAGAEMFNRAGFTHIRDMTSNAQHWSLNLELLENPDFLLHTEHWFVCEHLSQLNDLIEQQLSLKKQENLWMKIRGIKIFVDGSLGSETACLSHPYKGHSHSGKMIWSENEVKTVLRQAWKSNLEVALHSIGDQASHQVVQWAREVYSEGIQGYIHLEHAEILRPETIQNMKSLHIRCHLQPCHWWGDQRWLKNRVGDLFIYSFPWEALRKAQIPFSFGSDSPIEPSNFFSNLNAIQDAAASGIKKLSSDATEYHLYPGNDSVTGWTKIVDDQIHEIGLGQKNRKFI